MNDSRSDLSKIALIAELVRRAPNRPGRTAVMKYLYFLKVLKKVPLSYDFSLYTYGPFDSDVLDDLRYAEALGAVKSYLVSYSGGRGYEYKPGPQIDELNKQSKKFLDRHKDSVKWILREFGSRTAGDLEMASTLIYADRVAAEEGSKQGIAELARKVHAIKPYLAIKAIESEARTLEERGLLSAVE